MIVATAVWPTQIVARAPATLSSPVVAGGFVYSLVSRTTSPMRGPYVLERTSLRTHAVRSGPAFRGAFLAAAGGRLWVSGGPRLAEVDPRRLVVLRTIALPRGAAAFPRVAVATGPAASVWIGSRRTLLRIRVGRVLARVSVPRALAVDDVAVDPARARLYVSAALVVRGGVAGAEVLEYDADSGRPLARRLLRESVAGAELTAAPGGVWVSFRTGMLGLTLRLRAWDLAPSGARFQWPMSATALYGSGALWLADESGLIVCADPRSGKVRASERVPQSRALELLAVGPLLALDATGRRIVRLDPPRRCGR